MRGIRQSKDNILVQYKGGPGSGHYGHTGRPGQRGGSAPRGALGTGQAPQAKHEDMTMAIQKADHLTDGVPGLKTYMRATNSQREIVKMQLVNGLAEESGLSVGEVNHSVARWADTSADHDLQALLIQKDVAEEFSVPLNDYISVRLAEGEGLYPGEGALLGSGQNKTLLRSMYNITQASLRDAGFAPTDRIRLQRGVNLDRDATVSWEKGSVVPVTTNPMSSWTADTTGEIASRFCRYSARAGRPGYILEMEVPISAVLCTARTGFGCLIEGEFVILGNQHEARIVRTYAK